MIQGELNQKLVPRHLRIKAAWVSSVMRVIESHLRLRGTYTLSIAFVDHRTMQRLNRTYRHKNCVTDILSFAGPTREGVNCFTPDTRRAGFPMSPRREIRETGKPGEAPPYGCACYGGVWVGAHYFLGELILAWPYVRGQAKKNKKTLTEELALLLIHGVLHLRGYDHETKKDASRMLPLQDKILKNFLNP